jgi:isoquinoline 1-oxidoreductase alpha subunit
MYMPTYKLHINGKEHSVDVSEKTPVLWVIREHLGLTGTKYGCGIGQCGSCTIHVDGAAVKACAVIVDNIADGQKIKTIEALSENADHPLQRAWIEAQVPQCGYCQSGQIMQAATLLAAKPRPTHEEIISHMNGNICRCGTYMRIVKAIKIASEQTK